MVVNVLKYGLLLMCFFAAHHSFGQEHLKYTGFETSLPYHKQLKCGLWINSAGDIAYKDIAAAPPCDTCIEQTDDLIDYYISYTYNGLDSVNEYITELKNVVDTNTFQFVGRFYFKDKNYVYILNPMAYGGYFVINHGADVETFRALENPFYACDKNDCYAFSRYIEGADSKTFRALNVQDYLLARDKNHFYNWHLKIDYDVVFEIEKELDTILLTQNDIQTKVNNLKLVNSMPYICHTDIIDDVEIIGGDTIPIIGCGNLVFWDVVKLRDRAIPALIEKLSDTTQTEANVLHFGGNYTIADVAYVALQEIIHGIPTFDLLGVKFSDECGYCSYWWHVNKSIKNRQKFKKAVGNWYNRNKSNLSWVENDGFETCDCSGKHPAKGHFELQKSK